MFLNDFGPPRGQVVQPSEPKNIKKDLVFDDCQPSEPQNIEKLLVFYVLGPPRGRAGRDRLKSVQLWTILASTPSKTLGF